MASLGHNELSHLWPAVVICKHLNQWWQIRFQTWPRNIQCWNLNQRVSDFHEHEFMIEKRMQNGSHFGVYITELTYSSKLAAYATHLEEILMKQSKKVQLKPFCPLTHWGLVIHMCLSRGGHHWLMKWLFVCSKLHHYLIQCWLNVNWIITKSGDIWIEYDNFNSTKSISKHHFSNVHHFVNSLRPSDAYMRQ